MLDQRKKLSLLLLVFAVYIYNASAEESFDAGQRDGSDVIERVEISIKAIADFMMQNYKLLNLDALTVLRITEATLKSLGERYSEAKELRQTISEVINIAEPEIKGYEPEYYKQLGRLTNQDFWSLSAANTSEEDTRQMFMAAVVKKLKQRNKILKDDAEVLDEDTSDFCIEKLLKGSCVLDDACINLMTKTPTSGYTETHQVYYFIILEQMNCVTPEMQNAINEVKMDLCAGTFVDILTETVDSDIKRDLFMEQIGMCSLAGYYKEFCDVAWVEDILSWQTANGCYGDASSFMQELLSIDASKRFRRSVLQRSKREERIMDDNCLCHRTAVALLALSQSLRGLLDI